MSRFLRRVRIAFAAATEPSSVRHSHVGLSTSTGTAAAVKTSNAPTMAPRQSPQRPHQTFTGLIGAVCMYPLRAIIRACVAMRVHPNTLTLIGVIVNVGAAWALGYARF